ncbi:hypothetical protein GCM10009798_14200 [Nocardioides panacihumi]|uniref:Uncharacterized protein n=1 Tax=Nocardioides panacihumi TaxID=400774 RepID=A0ABP5C2G3_9ACTN
MPATMTKAQAPTVSVTFNGRSLGTLEAVASALTALDSLWNTCYLLAEWYYEPEAASRRTAERATAYLASRLLVTASADSDRTLSFLADVARSLGWSATPDTEDRLVRGAGLFWVQLSADSPNVAAPDAWTLLTRARDRAGDDPALLRGVRLDEASAIPGAWDTTELAKVPKPEHLAIRKGSPLWVELGGQIVGHSGLASLGFGLMAYCLKNPRKLAAFLPSLVEEWHSGWAKAEQAKRDHQRMREIARGGARLEQELSALEPGDVDVDGEVVDIGER